MNERTVYNSVEEWRQKAVEIFGTNSKDWKYRCPSCGGIQSIRDFEAARPNLDASQKAHRECISQRLTRKQREAEGREICNYTVSRVGAMTNTIVINNGIPCSVFDFALLNTGDTKTTSGEQGPQKKAS